ncbi:MAG: response regulator transcription factor [Actinomycetota bacterium]|jgi:two-component system, NarL family, nitrate/nitrite response regulator NarL
MMTDEDVLTVVLVDDHQLFSRGLELLLNTDPESRVRVLARTEEASRALELVRHHRPKVAIIDLVMPPPGGLAAVEAVKHHYPEVRVLALSGNDDVTSAVDALRAGADGFLLKSSEPDELVPPLIALASGVSVVPAPVMNALLDAKAACAETRLAGLCEDDIALLRLVAAGLESVEIAETLHVSERTAKRMVAALLRRIEVANRVQAAAFAGRAGLLEIGPSGSANPP